MSQLFELSYASRVSDLKWILSIRQWNAMLTGRRPTDTDLKTRDDLISLKMAQKQFRTVHWTAYSYASYFYAKRYLLLKPSFRCSQ